MEMHAAIPVLNRVEQQRCYGVDCGDAVRFDAGTWLPGGEHVKHITVKNVSKRSIKFKYELPSTKYFSMDFPTLITLSPGMHTVLDVAFRPVKLEEYDDFVVFHVHIIEGGVTANSGKFQLPVIARIASLSMNAPHGLDFGFCPTAETTDKSFVLQNNGQIDAIFDWTVAGAGADHGHPFAIRPASGRVAAGEAVDLIASFSPVQASVFVSTALCAVRPVHEESFVSVPHFETLMKLSGISKFTHLSASETELNFGELLVGAPSTSKAPTGKEFVLRNRSPVHATFQIVRVEKDNDPVFSFSPLTGVVPPESSLNVKVKYTPLSAGTFTCDHFDILTPGGNSVRMTCKGKAIGPVVSLWKKNLTSNLIRTRSINFQDVRVGAEGISRVLTLRNEAAMDVCFHIDAQQTGVFRFDKINGRIPPSLETNVTITFAPSQVGNYYRRFFILLQNQTTLYVDILGTGYDDKTRPSPFQQAHVDAYRARVAKGLGLLSPDQLETYWQDHGDDLFRLGALRNAKKDAIAASDVEEEATPLVALSQSVLTRSGEASMADVHVCHEYFVTVDDVSNPIVLSASFLDFGNHSLTQLPAKKTLQVTNNTRGKVTIGWRVSCAVGTPVETFQVFPESIDISAGQTAEFRIAFQPTVVNYYYFGELEGFVSFKSNRTFRLVNIETFTPPWCVVSSVCGNTFASPTDQFLPKVSFMKKAHFPPCYVGDSVFQTLKLENASDTPALFTFLPDPTEVFTCKPANGYVPAKSFQLVQIRFSPRKPKKYTIAMQVIINNARQAPETIELTGICALPQLEIESSSDSKEAKIFIKPTAIGLRSTRTISILNASRVPLVFRWEIPRKFDQIFRVSPQLGRLNGRESIEIECCFSPNEMREYLTRFHVSIKPISVAFDQFAAPTTRIPVLQETSVRVQTKGTAGAMAFEPQELVFDTILVNTSATKAFFIVNSADCDLEFALQTNIHVHSTLAPVEEGVDPAHLAFSQSHGCIPARSRRQIHTTFLPFVAGNFSFAIQCAIGFDGFRNQNQNQNQSQSQMCTVRAEASFPTILIEDIRVPRVPTSVAWQQFECRAINEYLSAPLSREEQKRNHDAPLDDELKKFVLPFTPAPLGAVTETVYMKLRNPGSLVVEYALRYPKEGTVEIEHWAETGAPSSHEVRTNAIIDSKIFGIAPRKATLLPKQSVVLALSYSYSSDAYSGVHDLPMLLEVDKGKKLVLELQGRTLGRSEPCLFLPQRVLFLSPVMIGECPLPTSQRNQDDDLKRSPPAQQIQVFNKGEGSFKIEISCQELDRINGDYGNFPVLQCQTSVGDQLLPPKSSFLLNVFFSPLEAKTLEANVIIKAHGMLSNGRSYKDVAMVTILATGYHPQQTTLAQLRKERSLLLPPPKQLMAAVPEQMGRFVCDCVDFGHVPMYSQVHQLLVLENTSATDCMAFAWDAQHPLITSGALKLQPMSGEVPPKASVLLRVTVCAATSDPIVIDHDLACFVNSSSCELNERKEKEALVSPTNKRRSSVVLKSTLTQEAVVEKTTKPSKTTSSTEEPVGRLTQFLKQSPRSNPSNRQTTSQSTFSSSASSTSISLSPAAGLPLFLHVFAHVLPNALYEQFYPQFDVLKLPLPLYYPTPSPSNSINSINSTPASTSRVLTKQPSSVRSSRPPTSINSKSPIKRAQWTPEAKETVVSVLESLVLDVLQSAAVDHAMNAQLRPLSPVSRARQASGLPKPKPLYPKARQSDDCAFICGEILENTMLNILQELFHGDLEAELLCVPRQQVYQASLLTI